MDYDWCILGKVPSDDSQDIWHMVAPASAVTVCGLAVASPDEEWRWEGALGTRRPCDNCTEIKARQADVEAAIASERDPDVTADVTGNRAGA